MATSLYPEMEVLASQHNGAFMFIGENNWFQSRSGSGERESISELFTLEIFPLYVSVNGDIHTICGQRDIWNFKEILFISLPESASIHKWAIYKTHLSQYWTNNAKSQINW